ncbi:hypothetical protein V8F20_000241 [Naviculisporaceae sp. PSN 640]
MVHVPVSRAASPTATAPLSQITSGPATEHVELRLRQNAAPTCAYLSGDIASPLTCGSGFSCTKGVYSEFGCCNEVECDSTYAVGCIDPSNQQCAIQGIQFECGILGPVLSCSDACITYFLKVRGFTTATYTSYACGSKGGTRIALSTATNGAGDSGDGDIGGGGGLVDNPTFPGVGVGATPTTTALNGGDGSNNNGNGGSSNNSNSPENSGGGGGIGAGAIAGIAVGSAAGALLVALLVWLLMRRKGKKAPPPNYSQTPSRQHHAVGNRRLEMLSEEPSIIGIHVRRRDVPRQNMARSAVPLREGRDRLSVLLIAVTTE